MLLFKAIDLYAACGSASPHFNGAFFGEVNARVYRLDCTCAANSVSYHTQLVWAATNGRGELGAAAGQSHALPGCLCLLQSPLY